MNKIEQSICQAIDVIVNKAVSDANYDRTIQGTVISCEDATVGKYLCQYQDSKFYAYSSNSDVTYTNGATVYILVPGNNMNTDKTILGTVKKLGINYVATIEDEEAYEVIGKNTLTSSAIYELSSYHKNKYVKTLYDKSYSSQQNLINLNLQDVNSYIKNAGSIILAANIKTKLIAEQQFRGNYGLIVGLDFLDNATNTEVTRYYTLDVDIMRGNPYKILNYTRQYGIFNIDGENFVRVSNISLFVQNFPNSKEEDECIADIFIKDIELCGAERLDSEGINSSMLTFLTLQGTYFDNNSLKSDTRSIKAQVRVKGKIADATSQNIPFYWFIEHAGITSDSQYYNKYGGQGWKCLNNFNIIKSNNDSDSDVVEWIAAGDTFTVKQTDIVAREVKYKCAAVYDGTVITKTITIHNLSSNYNIDIVSDLGTQFYFDIGYPTLTCRVNGAEAAGDYTYSWSVTDNSDNFSSIPDTPLYNSAYQEAYNNYYNLLKNIENEKVALEPNRATLEKYRVELARYDTINRVDKNVIYNLNMNTVTDFSIYRCTVYSGGIYIGTASITLVNSLVAEGQYNLIIHDGSKVFKYNENGVSPASNAVDSPIDIPALTFSVYDNLGNWIDDNILAQKATIKWLIPTEDTMIEVGTLPDGWEYTDADGIRTYTAKSGIALSFPYKIKDRYDITCTNNDIIIMIEYQGIVLSNKTSFTFVKEGESGTNGTDFVCRIVPNIVSGAIMPAYPMITENIYHQGVLNYTPINSNKYLRVQLWHNETKILDSVTSANTTEGKKATIEWEILKNQYTAGVSDVSALSVDKETGIFTFNGYKYGESAPANIVKATVTYDNVVYYATLPFVTAKITNNDYQIKLKDNTGFFSVLYSSDGQKAKYDNTKPFEAIVTQNIDGYWENVSTKNTSAYEVTYDWNCSLGAIYEDNTWVGISAFSETIGATTPNTYAVKPLDSYDGQCVSNGIEVAVKKSGNELCRMHIPIHMMLNRYGNSAINGWDGNSVQVDSEGGFILAPQVGAGIKENDNSFTGVVMGKVKETNKSQADIGLIGYARGVRSIFLDAQTGKAVFGANGKGQITIDPTNNTARIYSGNFVYRPNGTGTGMEIDLTTPQIRFGSGNFEVNKEGYITAKGGGSIAGWQITNTELYSPALYSGRKLTLDSANTKIYSGLKTALDSSTVGFHLSPEGLGLVSSGGGKILMKTSDNTPVIYSNNHSSLTSSAVGFYLSQDGLSLKSNYTKDGNTVASSLIFSTTGEPEIYSNSKNALTSTRIGFYLSGNGLSIGSKFYADNNGVMRLGAGAVANTGKHWEINGDSSNSYIKYGDMGDTNSVYISTGMISLGKKFYADNTGVVRVGNGAVDANGKYWTIDGGSESYIAYNTNASYLSTSDNVVSIGKNAPSSSVYLGTDGVRLGRKFAVDRSGNILAKYIKATGGTIGGWIISSNKLSATDGKMELQSNGTLKGGSSYSWSINSAGTATFNRIKADKGGTIGNCTISENGIYSSSDAGSWHINANGTASFNAITATGGKIGGWTINTSTLTGGAMTLNSNGSMSGTKWSITAAGKASFSDINVTGGSITLGGSTLNASGTKLTAGKTTVGSKSLQTYVEDLAVGKLTAADVTITASLDVGNSTYYLRMGQGTKNPEVSGLNIGSKGIRVNNGKSGQTHSINFVSSINGLTVSVHKGSIAGIETPIITSVTVKIDYSTRSISFYDGIHTAITNASGASESDTGS